MAEWPLRPYRPGEDARKRGSAAQAPGFSRWVRAAWPCRSECYIIQLRASNTNVVFSCKYHVVWCAKYRRRCSWMGWMFA